MLTLRMEASRQQLSTRQRVLVAIHRWRAKPENMGKVLTACIIGKVMNPDDPVAASTVFDQRGPLEDEGLIEPNPTGHRNGWKLTDDGIRAAVALSVISP